MENPSNKNMTIEEAYKKLGTPGLKTKVKLFFDQLKDYINSRPRSHKTTTVAGLGIMREDPLVYKFGGNVD